MKSFQLYHFPLAIEIFSIIIKNKQLDSPSTTKYPNTVDIAMRVFQMGYENSLSWEMAK